MSSLRKTTITTLEIAEMMETEHWKLLRKLEGRTKNGKHERGYIDILGDNQMDVTDFFIKSSYRTEQKVYETKATSLGEVASYTKEMDRRMEKQGTEPWKICEAFKMVSEQFGIILPVDFVKVPKYNQMNLFNMEEK